MLAHLFPRRLPCKPTAEWKGIHFFNDSSVSASRPASVSRFLLPLCLGASVVLQRQQPVHHACRPGVPQKQPNELTTPRSIASISPRLSSTQRDDRRIRAEKCTTSGSAFLRVNIPVRDLESKLPVTSCFSAWSTSSVLRSQIGRGSSRRFLSSIHELFCSLTSCFLSASAPPSSVLDH